MNPVPLSEARCSDRRIVITGGPGAGKTALLNALQAHGHNIVQETARALIQDRRRRGLVPRPGPRQFALDILEQDSEKYGLLYQNEGLLFFDRGIFDALAMLDAVSPISSSDLQNWISTYPYNPTVFFLSPWRDIYQNDSERDQTFADATNVYEFLRKWYQKCGYDIIDVPKVPITERCDFVLRTLGANAK